MQSNTTLKFDWREALTRFLKYMLEGATVGFAAAFVPKNRPSFEEIILLSVVAAATFSIIDLFAPSISPHARQGAGFAMGATLYSPSGPFAPGMKGMMR